MDISSKEIMVGLFTVMERSVSLLMAHRDFGGKVYVLGLTLLTKAILNFDAWRSHWDSQVYVVCSAQGRGSPRLLTKVIFMQDKLLGQAGNSLGYWSSCDSS